MIKDTLHHLPLEPYKARYTEMLRDWERLAFDSSFSVTEHSAPAVTKMDIMSGEVLDSVGRCQTSLAQVSSLLSASDPHSRNLVYCSDFFTPGLESLPYSRNAYKAFSYCWAQTFDTYDFTRKFVDWMRAWEVCAMSIYNKVFVACPEIADLISASLPAFSKKVEVVGLPFNSSYVKGMFDPRKMPTEQFDVVYSSRWDTEKDPLLFVSLVKSLPKLRFAVCTGHDDLRGSDVAAIRAAKSLIASGNLTLFAGCDKPTYYGVLKASKVQFNCALQDWISFTLLEALTFGCVPLYPMHRSFPAALYHSEDNLYAPRSLDSARTKLVRLLESEAPFAHAKGILHAHDLALPLITDIIKEENKR